MRKNKGLRAAQQGQGAATSQAFNLHLLKFSPLQRVKFKDLGNAPYKEVWDYQENLLMDNVSIKSSAFTNQQEPATNKQTEHHLLFVEHPPVFTLGKSGRLENVLISEEEMERRNIGFFRINRGGDITYHGPGQLVGYPILDLEKFYTDIGRYLRNIEEVIIRTIAEYGLEGMRSEGETGVWLDADKPGRERKICAIGVRCSRWITMHGFAFNVNTDLNYFNYIIPCGIADKQVTSLSKELGRPVSFEEVKEKVRKNFEIVFNVETVD